MGTLVICMQSASALIRSAAGLDSRQAASGISGAVHDGMRSQHSPIGVVVLLRARAGTEVMEHRAQAEDIVGELGLFVGFSWSLG